MEWIAWVLFNWDQTTANHGSEISPKVRWMSKEDVISYEDKLQVLSYVTQSPDGVGGFDFLWSELAGNILLSIVARGGGGFDVLWR